MRPLVEKAIARRPSGGVLRRRAAARGSGYELGLLRWGEHGGVLDGVEEFAAEVVHAGAELAQAGGELVVADDGRDGDDEAGGGGDEGF